MFYFLYLKNTQAKTPPLRFGLRAFDILEGCLSGVVIPGGYL